MNTKFLDHRLGLVAVVAMLIAGTQVWAADMSPNASASQAQPSKETREKMAQAHEKMAACLRSDRSISECHHEMMTACEELGEHACGMMHHRRMKPDGDVNPTSPKAK